jgi:hypothetical protein
MTRFSLSVATLCALTGLYGCNKAADEQKKADEAHADAQQKVEEANRDASKKIDAARADEDQKVAEAQANFRQMREDYRHKVTGDLTSLDKRITELESKDKTSTGKTKTQLDASLPNIHALRENVNTEYRSLEYASALTWDDAKGRVDKAYDELKKAIDKAD